MREKAEREKVGNLFVIDGFLHAIPLPDDTVDVLITSNAIGWNLELEMREVERVVRPCGHAIHLSGYAADDQLNPVHEALTSSRWGYTCTSYEEIADMVSGTMRRYSKKISVLPFLQYNRKRDGQREGRKT